MTQPLWIAEQDVVGLLDLPSAIGALRDGLRDEASGAAQTMVKTHATWDRSTLHAVGGVMPDRGLVGTKTWTHTPGGACPLLVLFDSDTGALRAVIEAFALGQLRTAAVSGLATDLLAPAGVDEAAVAGVGKQALGQAAALAAVRPLRRIKVWSRTTARAEDFAAVVSEALAVEVTVVETPAELARGVPLVTLVTRATEPFLDAAMLAPGTHLNAVGAITPERAEFESAILSRAAVVASDSVSQARQLARELRGYFADDDRAWARVRPLSALVADHTHRPPDADLTVFKAMGIGLADVALGARLLEDAGARYRGRQLPDITHVAPNFSPTSVPMGGRRS